MKFLGDILEAISIYYTCKENLLQKYCVDFFPAWHTLSDPAQVLRLYSSVPLTPLLWRHMKVMETSGQSI
jgi:hypothetical protein